MFTLLESIGGEGETLMTKEIFQTINNILAVMLVSLVLKSIYKAIGQSNLRIKHHSVLDSGWLLSSVIESNLFLLPVSYCQEITSWMVQHLSKESSINVWLLGISIQGTKKRATDTYDHIRQETNTMPGQLSDVVIKTHSEEPICYNKWIRLEYNCRTDSSILSIRKMLTYFVLSHNSPATDASLTQILPQNEFVIY